MFTAILRIFRLSLLLCVFSFQGTSVAADTPAPLMWTNLYQKTSAEASTLPIKLLPAQFALLLLDEPLARNYLSNVSDRMLIDGQQNIEAKAMPLSLPLPGGEVKQVQILETFTMSPQLAAKFPEIRTYAVYSDDLKTILGVADFTNQGFHAMFGTSEGTVFIDPRTTSRGERLYISYFKHDYQPVDKDPREMTCSAGGHAEPVKEFSPSPAVRLAISLAPRSGSQLNTYRLAVAATGEYTAFNGGTLSGALSGIVTSINRVNFIYERDLAVRLQLVANNNLIIYTDALADPYSNTDGVAMLDENQTNLDAVIGTANYDIGHVFSTGGGGIASLRSPCNANFKARGVTGSSQPVGDPFDIDYVAHEVGHQFGGNHTFNATQGSCSGNRNSSTAYEPGSGTSIMAYAGICSPQNLQRNSDSLFHSGSISEMISFVTTRGGQTCSTKTAISNVAPVANAGADFTIPANTPFLLTGSATDGDGNTLTYAWDEMDLGSESSSVADMVDDGFRPLFRSFVPSSSPVRYFPKLQSILSKTNDIGERLPSTSRGLKFRLTVRDQRGGVHDDDTLVTVTNSAGPFQLTAPNGGETLGSSTTVKWNVANTNVSPINCSSVNIGLSLDGGLTKLETPLASNVPNSGTASVTFPTGTSSMARILVQCSNSIFFDVSDSNFSFNSNATSTSQVITFGNAPTITVGSSGTVSAIASSGLPVVFSTLTPNICLVSGSTVTGIATGTCSIMASQSGNSTFAAATPVTQNIGVGLTSQTIGTISFNPTSLSVGGTSTASATATSGLAVSFARTTPTVCSVSGSTVTGIAAGTCTVSANQAGNANYSSAPQVTQNISVAKASQTIGTIIFSPSTLAMGGTTSASASATSGLAVTFGSTTPTICSVSGLTVTGVSSGTCTIAANQAGNVNYAAAPQVTANITVSSANPSRLINISTRGQVSTGDGVMIGGFIISGTANKKVLIRAIGPNLANFGIAGTLPDPKLELFEGPTLIGSNDNWQTQAIPADGAAIAATGLAPANALESALLVTLKPGVAYTVVVTGVNVPAGVGIVEVFEADHPEFQLINISTRGRVETGEGVMIGGFIIQGDAPKTVLIRAVGPNLVNFGVSDVLADPTMEIYRSSDGVRIAQNDDWQTQTVAADVSAITATGLSPADPRESAILLTLPPGAYTAVVSGKDGGTGVGIVEVFAR